MKKIKFQTKEELFTKFALANPNIPQNHLKSEFDKKRQDALNGFVGKTIKYDSSTGVVLANPNNN